MRVRRVWVVEMWVERIGRRSGSWQPCRGSEDIYSCAQRELAGFKERNPNDRFRIVRYEPAK